MTARRLPRCLKRRPETRYDASLIVGMQTPQAWVYTIGLFGGMYAVGLVERPLGGVGFFTAGLLILAACAVVLLVAPGDPLDWRASLVLLFGPPLGVLVGVQGDAGGLMMVAGALAALAVIIGSFTCVRGRLLVAWGNNLLVAAVAVVELVRGWPQPGVAVTVVPNLAVMLMATVFAAIVRPRAREIYLMRRQIQRETEAAAADQSRIAVRDQQMALLDEKTRPLLDLVARGGVVDHRVVRESGLVEAELRDRIRAPGLDAPEIAEAAWEARGRGVKVLLLDDRDPDHRGDGRQSWLAAVREAAVAELGDARPSGEVTVRLLPAGRNMLATVTALDGERVRRTEFVAEGFVAEGFVADGPVPSTRG